MNNQNFALVEFPFICAITRQSIEMAVLVTGQGNFLVWRRENDPYRYVTFVTDVGYYSVNITEEWKDYTIRQIEGMLALAIKRACNRLDVSKITKYEGSCPEIPEIEVETEIWDDDSTMTFSLNELRT